MPLTPAQKKVALTATKLSMLGAGALLGPAGMVLAAGSAEVLQGLTDGLLKPEEFTKAFEGAGNNANGLLVNALSDQLVKCLGGAGGVDLKPLATLSQATLHESLKALGKVEWAQAHAAWFKAWDKVLAAPGILQEQPVADLIRSVDFSADEDFAWDYSRGLLERLRWIHDAEQRRGFTAIFYESQAIEAMPTWLSDALKAQLPALMEAQFYALQTKPEHQAAKIQLEAEHRRWVVKQFGELVSALKRQSAPMASPLPTAERCFGREDLLGKIDAAFGAKARRLAITGAAGLGKSTLGLTALHGKKAKEVFGDRRFYLRGDGLATWGSVVLGLAERLGVPAGEFLWNRILAHLAQSRAVLMLDNFETPYQGAEIEAAERGLQELLGVAELWVIVAMQGEPPPAVGWDAHLRVTRLRQAEARKLFCSIAGEEFAADPDLDGLLEPLDGVARAVDLMAHQAQGHLTLARLRQRWVDEHHRLLSRGPGKSKDHSMAVTYKVALSHARLSDETREVLSALAAPPIGLDHAHLHVLGPTAGDEAVTLRNLSLLYAEGTRYRLLSPLRQYLLDERPGQQKHLVALERHYCEFAQKKGMGMGRVGGALAAASMLSELPNLEWAVREAVRRGTEVDLAVGAGGGVAEFSRFAGVGGVDLLRWLSEQDSVRMMAVRWANCELSLGNILLARSDHEGARKQYEKALPLYRGVRDRLGEANCERSLGDLLLRRSDHERAQKQYEKAQSLYREVGAKVGEAACEKSLGDILLERGDHERAQKQYEKAQPLYREMGVKLGEAVCEQRLGDILLERGDHERARKQYEKAQPLYRDVGAKLGEAACEQRLGTSCWRGAITRERGSNMRKRCRCIGRWATSWGKRTASRGWATLYI